MKVSGSLFVIATTSACLTSFAISSFATATAVATTDGNRMAKLCKNCHIRDWNHDKEGSSSLCMLRQKERILESRRNTAAAASFSHFSLKDLLKSLSNL